MTFDEIIIFSALFEFIIFLSVFSFATYKSPMHPIHNIFLSFCISFFASIVISWIFIPVLSIRILSLFLSSLLAFVYVFAIYLNLDSSLHVRILKEIAKTEVKGLTYKQLLNRYNKKIILEKRLVRLVNAGEIERVGNTFLLHRRFSFLEAREKIIVLLTKLYGK